MRKKTFTICIFLLIPLLLSSCDATSWLNFNRERQTSELSDGEELPIFREEPHLIRYMFATGKIPSDLQIVQDAINKIAISKINVEVELIPVSFGNVTENINLRTASGEQLDIVYQRGNTLSSDVSRGLLTPLDGLLSRYGQEIKEVAGDYLDATAINGVTYAIPTIRDMAASYGLIVRRDILERHGIEIESVKSLEEIETMFSIVKANEPDMIVTMPQIAGILSIMTTGFLTWDNLGDSIGVLMNHGSELNVVNLFETEEYKNNLNTIRRWYEKGYIWEDSSLAIDQASILLGSGKLFSYFSNLKPGFDRQESLRAGRELFSIEIKPAFATTSQISLVSKSIPVTSIAPHKAMQFINLMYSDPEIVNLFHWGVEGIHYERIASDSNIIRFPAGIDAITSGYNLALGWQFGNQLLSYIWEGENPDIFKELAQFNQEAIRSRAIGFTFDSENVQNEINAINRVIAQYRLPLENGALNPDVHLPRFIEALREAGIDSVISEKQNQLDLWYARLN